SRPAILVRSPSSAPHVQDLQLLVDAQALDAALATQAADAPAAAGDPGAHHAGVDVDRAGAQPLGDFGGLARVLAVDVAGEAEDGVVGHLDRVVDRLVADDADDRPEDLVLGRGVLVVGQIENGRLEEITL